MRKRVALVIQRYGDEVNGGAELHSRWIAEHLIQAYEIEVLTTRALDYVTWANHYRHKNEIINGIRVRRFRVTRRRDPTRFGRIQEYIFQNPHTVKDELRWLKEEGPCSQALIRFIRKRKAFYDCFIFFSYRYYTTYYGLLQSPEKSLLVPTAEADPVVRLQIFKDFFHKPRGILYNSLEEKELIHHHTHNSAVPGEITGVGINLPEERDADRFRKKYSIDGPFLLYLGRIDENKGCPRLFDYFIRCYTEVPDAPQMVLIGKATIEIPKHRAIRHLGFVSERDKFDALEAAEFLLMPSKYESLSMVVLEAWALGKAVLVNGDCQVLKGQVLRSNGGFYYHNYPEFRETQSLLMTNSNLRNRIGKNGHEYYLKNYSWPVIVKKYHRMIGQVTGE